MKNKMVTESLTILKIELHIVINMFLLKSERNSQKGNICQKRLSERLFKEDNMWRVSLDRQLA